MGKNLLREPCAVPVHQECPCGHNRLMITRSDDHERMFIDITVACDVCMFYLKRHISEEVARSAGHHDLLRKFVEMTLQEYARVHPASVASDKAMRRDCPTCGESMIWRTDHMWCGRCGQVLQQSMQRESKKPKALVKKRKRRGNFPPQKFDKPEPRLTFLDPGWTILHRLHEHERGVTVTLQLEWNEQEDRYRITNGKNWEWPDARYDLIDVTTLGAPGQERLIDVAVKVGGRITQFKYMHMRPHRTAS